MQIGCRWQLSNTHPITDLKLYLSHTLTLSKNIISTLYFLLVGLHRVVFYDDIHHISKVVSVSFHSPFVHISNCQHSFCLSRTQSTIHSQPQHNERKVNLLGWKIIKYYYSIIPKWTQNTKKKCQQPTKQNRKHCCCWAYSLVSEEWVRKIDIRWKTRARMKR